MGVFPTSGRNQKQAKNETHLKCKTDSLFFQMSFKKNGITDSHIFYEEGNKTVPADNAIF